MATTFLRVRTLTSTVDNGSFFGTTTGSGSFANSNGATLSMTVITGTLQAGTDIGVGNTQQFKLTTSGSDGLGEHVTVSGASRSGSSSLNAIVPQMAGLQASLIATGTGNLTNGTYFYVMTFITNGIESPTSPSRSGGVNVIVDANHKQVALRDITLGPSGTTARRLYRTSAGGATRKLLDTISDNTTTIYTDNIADASLVANIGDAAAAALAGLGAGNVNNGTHRWIYTYVISGAEAPVSTLSNTLTVTDNSVNGKVALTSVSVGPTGTTDRKIYRTRINDGATNATGASYLLVGTISDNVTTTFTDNVADSGLGAYAALTSAGVGIDLTQSGTPPAQTVNHMVNYTCDAPNTRLSLYGTSGNVNITTTTAARFRRIIDSSSSQQGTVESAQVAMWPTSGTFKFLTLTGIVAENDLLKLSLRVNFVDVITMNIQSVTGSGVSCYRDTVSTGAILAGDAVTLSFTLLNFPGSPTSALAGLGAGNINNGTHSWRVTFVVNGWESGASNSSNTTNVTDNTVNGQVSLTSVPLGPTGTTARNIYRTVAGNGGNHKFVGTISDNTTTTFTDNVADGSLGANAPAISGQSMSGEIQVAFEPT